MTVRFHHGLPICRVMRWGLLALLLVAGSHAHALEQPSEDYAAAIRAVIEADYALGSIRNEAPRHAPIATAIEEYVKGLDALDLVRCPPDFVTALRRHRDAWFNSITFFEQHSELRGELHEVFEAIHAKGRASHEGMQDVEADIWDTWSDVEASIQRHDAATGPAH